ncbi:MAG TPA: hypothetical protein VFB63_25555 [Bryobacteraceae bacterium]|nr:hypothetical protein [Bryobacteraceae bacterium]
MTRTVLHRLEKLESNIGLDRPRVILKIQYISPQDMSVVGEYEIEVDERSPKWPNKAERK